MKFLGAIGLLTALAAPTARAVSAQEGVVYSFSPVADGAVSFASLVVGSDGNFYGTSLLGGVNGKGTVFKMSPSGSVSVLHSFGSGTDGFYPYSAVLQAADGDYYGTAADGGPSAGATGSGVVFRISAQGTYSLVYSFGSTANDGWSPQPDSLVQGADGALYGTTWGGGLYNKGTVFKVSPTSVFTQLHSFGSSEEDSAYPSGGLVLHPDGNFYGVTVAGGPRNAGSVFKLTPSGGVSVIYRFGSATCSNNASGPEGALLVGSDGRLYGTTEFGGTHLQGTIYRITTAGAESVLYSFGSIADDGDSPQSGLIQLSDGSLIGTTPRGGPYDKGPTGSNSGGTAFLLASDGTYTRLHAFGGSSSDGQLPQAPPVLGADQNLYGTAAEGGLSGAGVIYKLTLNASGTGPSVHSDPYACNPPSEGNTSGGSVAGGLDLVTIFAWLTAVFLRFVGQGRMKSSARSDFGSICAALSVVSVSRRIRFSQNTLSGGHRQVRYERKLSGGFRMRRFWFLCLIASILQGCATVECSRKIEGPRKALFFAGTRLDWAAIRNDTYTLERFYREHSVEPPAAPVLDLPFSFALDSLVSLRFSPPIF